MKKLFILGLVLTIAGMVCVYFGVDEDAEASRVNIEHAKEQQLINDANKLLSVFNNAKTCAEIDEVISKVESLPKALQSDVLALAKLRRSIFLFEEAEALLDRAKQIQQALVSPKPTPVVQHPVDRQDPRSAPQGPAIVPPAMELLEKAMPLYEAAKSGVDQLGDSKTNQKYNFTLNYTKGEIYHRYLQVFSTQENAREILAQAVMYYRMALKCQPVSRETVINIELLIKDAEAMGSAGSKQQKNRLLNQAPGGGHLRGN